MYNIKYSGTFKNINNQEVKVDILEKDLEYSTIEDYWISSGYTYFTVYINTEVTIPWPWKRDDIVEIRSATGDFEHLNGNYKVRSSNYEGGYVQLFGTPDELSGFSGDPGELHPVLKELLFSTEPVLINYNENEFIFDPIQSSGLDLNLFSDSNLKYLDLYTDDIFKFKVNLYVNDVLTFNGYLNSEIYNEPLNSIDNYPVNITGNDGFQVLERLDYLDDDGNKYSGITTQWEVINNILDKLDFESDIYVGVSTLNSLTTDTGSTIFKTVYCYNENYYNEDGDPENCYTVLESILQPYGMFITKVRKDFFITDHNIIFGNESGNQFKQFFKNGLTSPTFLFNMNLGDLSDIGFNSSNQSLNYITPINKQLIKYSPYKMLNLFNWNNVFEFTGFTEKQNFGTSGYKFSESYYTSAVTFNVDNNPNRLVVVQGEGYNNLNITHNVVFISGLYNGNHSISIKDLKLPFINKNSNNFIKVELDAFINGHITELKEEYEDDEIDYCDKIILRGKYNFTNDVVIPGIFNIEYNEEGSNICGKWIKMVGYIPIETYGVLNLSFGHYYIYNFEPINGYSTKPWALYIKGIRLNVVDSDKVDIKNSDVEYIGYLNEKVSKSGSNIVLLNGTSVDDFPIERGSLKTNQEISSGYTFEDYVYYKVVFGDYETTYMHKGGDLTFARFYFSGTYFFNELGEDGDILQHVSNGDTIEIYEINDVNKRFSVYVNSIIYYPPDEYDDGQYYIDGTTTTIGYNTMLNITSFEKEEVEDQIEKLLLRSIVSNYKNPRLKLSVDLKGCIYNRIGHLKYDNYFEGKKFMISGVSMNIGNNSSEIALQEINKDYLEINDV